MSGIFVLFGILVAAASGAMTMAFFSHKWKLEPGWGDQAPGKGVITAVGAVVGAIAGAILMGNTAAEYDAYVTFLTIWASATIIPLSAVFLTYTFNLCSMFLKHCLQVTELMNKPPEKENGKSAG